MILVLSARIGEAAHPGPVGSKLVVLGACNPTGLNGKHATVATLPVPSLFAVSETHLTADGVHKFRQGLKLSGSEFSFLPGHPAPLRPRSKVVGSHTGVGFLSSFPVRAAAHAMPPAAWQSSRVQVASVFLHAVWLLAGVVYGHPTHTSTTMALLEEATQRIVFEGDGPRLLAGDFNLEEKRTPILVPLFGVPMALLTFRSSLHRLEVACRR